ncbi:MAG: phosphate/phosphite/phosphonate ABC transporter substrate-binding protein [Desulfomonile tiedjei]|nr:phosphate/phosphite/phosphonate ABC transporter substrate-binding protein [Desulfomonile tiedjei]
MKTRFIAVLAFITLAVCPSIAVSEIKIGMLAQRGPEKALEEWGGIAAYLSEKLDDKVTIVPLKFSEFMDFCDVERSGFIFTNPWFYVRAKVLKGAKALVTVKYKGSGETMGGVIFARKDSGIAKIEDMRGKTVMVPKLSSPGGWLFQKGEIVRNGISPERDFKLLLETEKESHDQVVYAVKDGKADVGTVRNNILETMQREGKISIGDFIIINRMNHPGFPELCSTPLYPDWPVATLKDTPEDTSRKLQQALLNIPPGHPALEQARKLEKFVDALDYGPIEELCRFLKVPPFKK